MQNDPISTVINSFVQQNSQSQGGDPAVISPTPAPAPNLVIPMRGQVYHFASPEQAGNVFGQTIDEFQVEIQRLQAERDQARQLAQLQNGNQGGSPPSQTQPTIDPNKFAQKFLENPADAVYEALNANPEFKKTNEELARLRSQVAKTEFFENHPTYKAMPTEVFQEFNNRIEKVREHYKLPETREGYEASLGLAINHNVVPPEGVLRQKLMEMQYMQQPQQPVVPGQVQQMPQAPQANYPGAFQAPPPNNVMQFPQNGASQGYNPYAPPPSPGRSGGYAPATDPNLELLTQNFSSLPLAEQKRALQQLEMQLSGNGV